MPNSKLQMGALSMLGDVAGLTHGTVCFCSSGDKCNKEARKYYSAASGCANATPVVGCALGTLILFVLAIFQYWLNAVLFIDHSNLIVERRTWLLRLFNFSSLNRIRERGGEIQDLIELVMRILSVEYRAVTSLPGKTLQCHDERSARLNTN